MNQIESSVSVTSFSFVLVNCHEDQYSINCFPRKPVDVNTHFRILYRLRDGSGTHWTHGGSPPCRHWRRRHRHWFPPSRCWYVRFPLFFQLNSSGHLDIRRKSNFLIVDSKTTTKQIETAYKEFAAREDIAVILINQYIANMIRSVINNNTKPVPATLEVPSKDCPYDPTQDSILARVQFMVGMN